MGYTHFSLNADAEWRSGEERKKQEKKSTETKKIEKRYLRVVGGMADSRRKSF